MRNFNLLAVAIVTAVTVTGCVDRPGQKAAIETAEIVNDPMKEVSVSAVKVEDLQELLPLNGEISTTNDAQISAQTGGKIAFVSVKEGDSVQAGQVVAMLDATNLQSQASQARAALASAQAQLSQATNNARLAPSRSTAAVRQAEAVLGSARAALKKALNGSRTEEREQAENNFKLAQSNFETAKKNLERVRKLVKEGALAESQLDAAQNSFDVSAAQYENALQAVKLVQNSVRPEDIEAARDQVRSAEQALENAKASKKLDVTLTDQVTAARAQVESARAQLAIANTNLYEASIRSPFAGKIYGKPLQAGVVVGAGTPIAHVIGGSGVYFEGQAPSDKVGRIQIGTKVTISVDGVPGATFPGKVLTISPQGDNVGRLFNVRIQFDQVSSLVKPGMFANGTVVLGETKGAMLVNEEAIISRDGIKYIMAAEGDKAKKIVVTTGIKKGAMVEVKGLSNTTQVITKGQGALVDGSKIRIEKPAKGA